MTGRFRAVATTAALVLAVGITACSSSSTSTATSTTTAEPATSVPTGSTPGSTPGSVPGGTTARHVFVINLENKGYDETFGPSSPAPYLSKDLPAKGQLLSQYHGIGHASLDNYLAQISGQAPNPSTQADCATFTEFEQTGTADNGQAVGKGCVYPTAVQTVADQLEGAGLTWKGYMEDMASPCLHPAIGEKDAHFKATETDQYATRHNPFVYFHSIIDDQAACEARVVNLSALDADLASAASTPNLVYITPDQCSDGHDAPCADGRPGGLVSADEFLKTWVPKILASPAFAQGGLLIVTFDEAELAGDQADSSACCGSPTGPNTDKPGITGPGGGRTGAVVIGAGVEAGSVNDTPYNHYALLCSIEENFGLAKLGLAGQPGLRCFGPDVDGKG